MKVNNLNNLNNVKYINSYKANNQSLKNGDKNSQNDKCEISSVGKALNNLAIAGKDVDLIPKKDIEAIKNQIASGKYKVDSSELAQKLVDAMKGRA